MSRRPRPENNRQPWATIIHRATCVSSLLLIALAMQLRSLVTTTLSSRSAPPDDGFISPHNMTNFARATKINVTKSNCAQLSLNSAIQASSKSCNMDEFNYFYRSQFWQVDVVPFHSDCLKELIRQYSNNLHLRIAHVRRRYFERMNMPLESKRSSSSSSSFHRYLFYRCRASAVYCGGHGDRLRGMTRAFYLALATDSKFAIRIEGAKWEAYFKPIGCDLDFLTPLVRSSECQDQRQSSSSFQRRGDVQQCRLSLPSGETTVHREIDNNDHFNNSGVIDWEALLFPPRNNTLVLGDQSISRMHYSFVESNLMLCNLTRNPHFADIMDDYRLLDLHNSQLYHIFLQLYASSPTSALTEATEHYQNILRGKFIIGMQIRLGQTNAGHGGILWKDPLRHPPSIIPCLIQKAKEICSMHQQQLTHRDPRNCTALVTADNSGAIKQVERGLQNSGIDVISPRGAILHIDRSTFRPETVITDNMKMFVDWLLLANMSDALLMSRSGFSFMAALYRSNGTHLNYRPVFRPLDKVELRSKKLKGHCVLVDVDTNGVYNDTVFS